MSIKHIQNVKIDIKGNLSEKDTGEVVKLMVCGMVVVAVILALAVLIYIYRMVAP